MTWISRAEEYAHKCDPPMELAYTDINFIERCEIKSWNDIWRCDECGTYWYPQPGFFPWHSSWKELKGLRLWWRMRKIVERIDGPTPL